MNGINKAIIVGTLGVDPESKTGVTKLSVATTEKWKDKQGQQQEQTEWHRVILFQPLADIAAKYLKKGSQVYIEGRIQTKKYQKDNQDRYITEVIGREMQMLGSPERKPETSIDDDIPF